MKAYFILFVLFFSSISLNTLAQKENYKLIDTPRISYLSTIGNDSIVSLPIVYKKDGVILFTVTIDGKEYVFVFDTGATTCLISKEISINDSSVKTITYQDGFGNENKADLVLKNYKIGNSSFNNIPTIVSDLKLLNELGCIKIDGIIGANLINLCNWQIDPQKQIISFSKLPFKSSTDNSSKLKLEYTSNGLPHIKLSYDEIPFYALVDFGFAGYLNLNKAFLKKSKKIKKIKTIKGMGSHSLSVSNEIKGNIFHTTLDTLIFSDNLKFPNIPINFDEVGPILGSSFFNRFVTILNAPSKELILITQSEEYTNSKFFPIRFGLNNLNELIINFIWETDEMKQSGVQIGQKVLRINDKIFNKISKSDFCELKNYLTEITNIKITVQMENEIKELELTKTVN